MVFCSTCLADKPESEFLKKNKTLNPFTTCQQCRNRQTAKRRAPAQTVRAPKGKALEEIDPNFQQKGT